MPDEKKKKSRVVAGRESICRVEASGTAPDVGVSLNDQFPPDPPLYVRLLSVKRRGCEWKTRAQRLTTSQRSFLWVDFFHLVVGASRRASPLRKQSGELVSFQRQRLRWIRLDYQFVSFQKFWDFTLASCSIR